MPRIPDHPCSEPGCPKLVPRGKKYCPDHAPLHPETVRSATQRGYGSAWQRESKRFLKMHPLCEECMKHGRYVLATVVDHIQPHRGNTALFWNPRNWQALCKHCHDVKTGLEDSNPEYHY